MTFIKMKTFEAWILSVIAVFSPIKIVLIITGFLILADLASGVLAAYKRGERITSSGFRRTITKMFVYQTALITAFLVETYLLGSVIPMVKLVSAVIGLTESLSIFENLNSIQGQNIFGNILSVLKSKNDNK